MGRPKKYTKKTLAEAVDRYFASITRIVPVTELVETGERDDKGHKIFERRPVTNSLGDVESLPLKVEVIGAGNVNPAVRLSEYIVYLQAGERFSPADYVTAPADPGEVEIESDVAASTPGVYEVSYTYRGDTVYQTVVVR